MPRGPMFAPNWTKPLRANLFRSSLKPSCRQTRTLARGICAPLPTNCRHVASQEDSPTVLPSACNLFVHVPSSRSGAGRVFCSPCSPLYNINNLHILTAPLLAPLRRRARRALPHLHLFHCSAPLSQRHAEPLASRGAIFRPTCRPPWSRSPRAFFAPA